MPEQEEPRFLIRTPRAFLLVSLGINTDERYNQFLDFYTHRPVKLKDNIRKLRKKHKIKQIDICKRRGWAASLLSVWETGQSTPCLKNLLALAEELGVTPDELIWGDHAASKD